VRIQTKHRLASLWQVVGTSRGLWPLICLTVILITVMWTPVSPNDYWWHVRAGEWLVEHRQVPSVDLFTFTRAGQPWAYQSWLAQVVMYVVYSVGHIPLTLLLNGLAVTAAYAVLFVTNRHVVPGRLRLPWLATLYGVALGFGNWAARPQTFSIVLFPFVLYVLASPHRRLRWILPALFALWANLHGGFIFGLGLVGCYVGGEAIRALQSRSRIPWAAIALAAGCALAILLTPLGMDMVDYVLGFLRSDATLTFNMEFASPTIRRGTGAIFFASIALLVWALNASHYTPRPGEILRLVLFAVLGLISQRCIIWFGFAAAPVLAKAIAVWRHPTRRKQSTVSRTTVNRALVLLVVTLCVLSLPWVRPGLPVPDEMKALVSDTTPVDAVAYLCETEGTPRVFHNLEAGVYMAWACPAIPTFMDTRFELYPQEQWQDYLGLWRARYDWEEILARYEVDTLLLDKEDMESLLAAATASPLWEQVYEDETTVILVRQE